MIVKRQTNPYPNKGVAVRGGLELKAGGVCLLELARSGACFIDRVPCLWPVNLIGKPALGCKMQMSNFAWLSFKIFHRGLDMQVQRFI